MFLTNDQRPATKPSVLPNSAPGEPTAPVDVQPASTATVPDSFCDLAGAPTRPKLRRLDFSQKHAAAATPEQILDARAQDMVGMLAKRRSYPASDDFGVPPPSLRRFDNLGFVQASLIESSIPIGGEKRINAHWIGPRTIATQAPMDQSPQYMAALSAVVMEQDVGLIVDLTTEKDQTRRALKYREGGTYRTSEGTEASIEIGAANVSAASTGSAAEKAMTFKLKLANGVSFKKELAYLNAPVKDMRGTDAGVLRKLIGGIRDWRAGHPGQSVVFHCTAGVGRTGMAVVAERLANLHDQGLLTEANLDESIKAEVLFARSQRSDAMVQTADQFRTLMAFGQLLLEETSGAAQRA